MGKRIDLHRKVSGSTVMKWVLVIFMAFIGVMALSEKQIFPGIIAALTVILLLSKKISRKVKITSFLIGFYVFGFTIDTSVNKNNSKSNNTPEQTEKIVKEKGEKPSSKAQSNDKSSEAKNSVPTNDSEDNENGWKNLKWGMTLDEVLKFRNDYDETEPYDNCRTHVTLEELRYGILGYHEIYYEREKTILNLPDDVKELRCFSGTGVFFYKGKFFGKGVKIYDFKNDKKTQDILITQLKEKYPNGKISYYYGKEGWSFDKYVYETELSLLDKLLELKKIPVFEYKSNKITVFINNDFDLYFYDTKVLDELVRRDKEQQKKIEDDKTSKTKQLF